jgi:23S rRNA pseudouridine2605 synthase
MRLNKFIAQSGVASRREADKLIESGRVLVDGKRVTALGTVIDPINSKVNVDGKTLRYIQSKTYLAFYKPRGILSTMSEDAKDSLAPFVNEMRTDGLFHVGRLDKDSEGLLLLTNDGDWANKISHPRFGIAKEYEIETRAPLTEADLSRLQRGVILDDGSFRLDKYELLGNHNCRVEIHDGRNRVLRRAFEVLNNEIVVLKRTRVGEYKLGRLKPGQWKEVNP